MKRNKFDKSRKFAIYKVDTYSKSAKPYDDGTYFEHHGSYLYYLDSKRKRVFEQSQIKFKDRTHYYVSSTPHRSMASMERKYKEDFQKFSHIFSDFTIKVTRMAIL